MLDGPMVAKQYAAALWAGGGGTATTAQAATTLSVAIPQSATKTFGTIRLTDRHHKPKKTTYNGIQTRTITNQLKPGNRQTLPVHVFTAQWAALSPTEVLVPTSFLSKDDAAAKAHEYIRILGQIPVSLRAKARRIHVIPGLHNITGGGGDINLYQGSNYPKANYANMFTHEAAHTMNNDMRANPTLLAQWNAAVTADRLAGSRNRGFISKYAADNPTSEDFGESLVAWSSLKFHQDRLREADPAYPLFIESQIPNRIRFLRSFVTDLSPLSTP